jgi:two-component sensor histidine kinase
MENSRAETPDSKNIIQALSGRIHSMALVHEKLYQSENFSGIRLKEYIPELCSHITDLYPDLKNKIKTDFNIDDSFLDIIKGIPFGILMNEIISNSCKHAFPGKESGTITVNISKEGYNLLVTVEDDGIGIDAEENMTDKTQGLELIRLLVNQLGGTITRTSVKGLKYSITFPVERSNG